MSDYFYKYVTNPVIKLGGSIFKRQSSGQSGDKVVETIIKHEYQKLEPFGFKQLPASSCFLLRVAAISGCCAVVLSAYGSHVMKNKNQAPELRELFSTAQYYHMVHSVAMLSLPLVKRPLLTGSLWISGLVLFCGSMYYHALTNDGRFKQLTPYGGFCLIGGWLSILI